MYWSPNFLSVVCKNQEILQQVLFQSVHLIVFFGSNNQVRNNGRKVEFLELI